MDRWGVRNSPTDSCQWCCRQGLFGCSRGGRGGRVGHSRKQQEKLEILRRFNTYSVCRGIRTNNMENCRSKRNEWSTVGFNFSRPEKKNMEAESTHIISYWGGRNVPKRNGFLLKFTLSNVIRVSL